MIYTMEQLKERVAPVARKHGLPAVYVFGSYARGEATEKSDVDILVDQTGTALRGLYALGGLYNEFCEAFDKKVDLITTAALDEQNTPDGTPWFVESVNEERVKLFG